MSRGTSLTCVVLVVAVSVVHAARAQDLKCRDNEDECLQALRDTLTRTDLWFGDPYSLACPDGVGEKNFACGNPARNHKTIISRIFQEPDFDVDKITKLLRIRFYVPAGSYRACGHTFQVPASYMNHDLPLSEDASLDSWTMQARPAITWGPDRGAVYGLAAYNLDLVQLVGLWVNIHGSDSALGSELSPFSGPLAALNRTSFLVFVLFKQSEVTSNRQVDLAKEELRNRGSGTMLTMRDLQNLLGQIVEPVGAGLVPTGADPYGIERHKSSSLVNNCPWLIARMRPLLRILLDTHNLTALGADASRLGIEVEVRYTSKAVTFTSCCQTVTERARTLQVDPLSQSPVKPVYLRSQPFVKLSAVNMLDSNIFFDKLYTILLLDVTWATASPGQRQTSLLWHVTDIPGQYVAAGSTRKEYALPLPAPDRSGNSLFVFFVFRQSDLFRNYTADKYCGTLSVRGGGCDFNLHKFVLENSLQLSGVNWLWSQPDLYSRMKLYETDVSKMDSACRGVSGYSRLCPDKCSPPVAPTSTSTAPPKVTSTPAGGTRRLSANEGLVLVVPILLLAIISIADKTSSALDIL